LCPIYVIHDSKEPLEFTSLFHGWDFETTQPKEISTVERITVNITGNINGLVNSKKEEEVATDDEEGIFFSYDRLTERPLPPEIGPDQSVENFLRNKDFLKIFNMTKDQFKKLPKWKTLELKKEKGLF